jgi:hypothetical protein
MEAKLDCAYVPSEEVVARVIEDELIIVPLTANVGDLEDELYTLNETGRAIWDRLDGKASLQAIVAGLQNEFNDPSGEIEQDVLGLVNELLGRRMLIESH